MADLNIGGPITGIIQTAGNIFVELLKHDNEQISMAPTEELKTQLIEQRLKRLKRLNWIGDRLLGIVGYKDDAP